MWATPGGQCGQKLSAEIKLWRGFQGIRPSFEQDFAGKNEFDSARCPQFCPHLPYDAMRRLATR
jgi:hypothetical protein